MQFRRFVVALVLVTAATPAAIAATAKTVATRVAVYPTAGTPVANPASQISFRGASLKQLGGVTVAGSRSGRHSGHLAAHSDGRGASFLPDKRFAAGETVTVRAKRQLVGAGRDGAVRFRTFVPANGVKLKGKPDAGGTPDVAQHFHSEPGLLPPSIRTLSGELGGSAGDVFTSPKIKKGQDGAMITDVRGGLLWFHRAPLGTSIYEFRAQTYLGRPALTWWQGRILNGKGIGEGVIYDSAYHRVARVHAGNGYRNDEHEFRLTPQGTALITFAMPVTYDLRRIGGPKHGIAYDTGIQEVDVRTGLVVFEWHGIGHIRFAESYETYHHSKPPFDPYHVNSVQPEADGDLLISARNTDAAYEISRRSGRILWRLGGKRTNFAMGPGAQFVGQHDVKHETDGTVTVFDNGAGIREQGFRPARGIVLGVDARKHTARLVRSLMRQTTTLSASQGDVQRLPDGHYFVGWGGTTPFLSEFDPGGKLVLDARFDPPANNTYRAYRMPWHGEPAYRPAVAAARQPGGGAKVWASWNGATEVATWEVLGGPSPSALVPLALAPRAGFETAISLPAQPAYVAVRAHAGDGNVLRTSRTISVSSGGGAAR